MARERYRTPDEDVSAEFNRVCQLFQLALGRASDRVLFDSLMAEASENGLNWVQGLEYVIERRGSAAVRSAIDTVPLRTQVSGAVLSRGEPENELQRAG